MIRITPSVAIDDNEVHEEFLRAPGPGGQNVNKVSTAVRLRFDVAHSPSLSPGVRRRLLDIGGRRITQDGVLIIISRVHRTQARNRQEARCRLMALIRRAAVVPRRRLKTGPSAAARKRRLRAKRLRGEVKRSRASAGDYENGG